MSMKNWISQKKKSLVCFSWYFICCFTFKKHRFILVNMTETNVPSKWKYCSRLSCSWFSSFKKSRKHNLYEVLKLKVNPKEYFYTVVISKITAVCRRCDWICWCQVRKAAVFSEGRNSVWLEVGNFSLEKESKWLSRTVGSVIIVIYSLLFGSTH